MQSARGPNSQRVEHRPQSRLVGSATGKVMGVAGPDPGSVHAAPGVKPEALALNNVWALSGRRLIRSAIKRERPDVIVATAPPPSALLATAATAAEVPLVAELRDLWAGNPYYDRGGSILPGLQRRALESLRGGCHRHRGLP